MLHFIALVFLVIWLVSRKFAPNIYNYVILKMTSKWYRTVLEDISEDSKVLDIGIGPGSALVANSTILKDKNISVIGVDYDEVYVNYAKSLINKENLQNRIKVKCASVYDVEALKLGQFEAVYFSGSFSLLPDPIKALETVNNLLVKNGIIYITQTYQKKSVFGMKFLKPLLRYITTIDFGQLVYEYELENLLKNSNFKVLENKTMAHDHDYYQSARFIKLASK